MWNICLMCCVVCVENFCIVYLVFMLVYSCGDIVDLLEVISRDFVSLFGVSLVSLLFLSLVVLFFSVCNVFWFLLMLVVGCVGVLVLFSIFFRLLICCFVFVEMCFMRDCFGKLMKLCSFFMLMLEVLSGWLFLIFLFFWVVKKLLYSRFSLLLYFCLFCLLKFVVMCCVVVSIMDVVVCVEGEMNWFRLVLFNRFV